MEPTGGLLGAWVQALGLEAGAAFSLTGSESACSFHTRGAGPLLCPPEPGAGSQASLGFAPSASHLPFLCFNLFSIIAVERGVRLKIIFFTKQRAKKISFLLHREAGLREQKALDKVVRMSGAGMGPFLGHKDDCPVNGRLPHWRNIVGAVTTPWQRAA